MERFNSNRPRGWLGPLGCRESLSTAGQLLSFVLNSVSNFRTLELRGRGHLFHILLHLAQEIPQWTLTMNCGTSVRAWHSLSLGAKQEISTRVYFCKYGAQHFQWLIHSHDALAILWRVSWPTWLNHKNNITWGCLLMPVILQTTLHVSSHLIFVSCLWGGSPHLADEKSHSPPEAR